jgi:hypothetical protein
VAWLDHSTPAKGDDIAIAAILATLALVGAALCRDEH